MLKYGASLFIFFAAAIALFAVPALASPTLPAPLEAALVDAEARYARAGDVRFYFQRKIIRFGEKFLEKSYNPAGPEGQQWDILFPDAVENHDRYRKQVRKHAKKKDGADRKLLLVSMRERLGKGVIALREDEEELVYGFEIADEYYISGEGKGADIAKYMGGEIAVGKEDGMIHWVHYVAHRKFRPIPIAKIKQFDIYQQFAPAWHDGPMVRVLERNKVAGTAIIRKIKFDDVVTNFDFRPLPE